MKMLAVKKDRPTFGWLYLLLVETDLVMEMHYFSSGCFFFFFLYRFRFSLNTDHSKRAVSFLSVALELNGEKSRKYDLGDWL